MERAFSADLPSRIRFRHLSCFVAIAQERNLRRAAELQDEAKSDAHVDVPSEDGAPETPLPDFNT